MTPWLITAVLAVVIAWIVFTEVKCGRRSENFFIKTNAEIDALRRSAMIAYRAKFGRDPTAPFVRIDDGNADKVSSKEP